MTLDEAAAILRISRRTLHRLIAAEYARLTASDGRPRVNAIAFRTIVRYHRA
jgi:predicted DNA-binding protein (UPF0251 family)